MARSPRPPRFHSSNVLHEAGGRGRLWSFLGAEARPGPVTDVPADDVLPAKLVGKGWAQLVQRRLNVAWIGDQPTFLQLVHLPTDDRSEVPAMLELQIEKLSPLPLGQVVWSYEVLPQPGSGALSVLVAVVEKSVLESQLGGLEKRGFCADRVDSPLLRWVAGTQFSGDGPYLFVQGAEGRRVCLVGWVAGGMLRALNVVNLSDDDRWMDQLQDELRRLAWAGELAGWANGSLSSVCLVADTETVAAWRDRLQEALGVEVRREVRPSDADLAAATVRRAARAEPGSNLLPPGYEERYRQEFTDRLWMGGLMGLMAAYLVGVLIYLGLVEIWRLRQTRHSDRLAGINVEYTNTLRLKAQAQVMQETVNLRFAALDCWMATVEAMPEELSLENLSFSGGQSLTISGWAPAGEDTRITEFWQALQRKVVGNTNLFSSVKLGQTTQRVVGGVPQIQWSFNCRFQRPEI